MMDLELTSSAFRQGENIPSDYTADGRNASPPLEWNDPPGGTQALALICEDPDAPRGAFTHWVMFNVPPETRALPEEIPHRTSLPDGTLQGPNDTGEIGYAGPAPPPGKRHRYFFRLYALDTALGLPPGATRNELQSALQRHVLAEGALMGTYRR